MAEFTRDITRVDGHIVQIGDCDNGRFLKLHPCYSTDGSALEEDQLSHDHLVAAIGSLLGRPNARISDNEPVDSHVVRRLAGASYDPEQCAVFPGASSKVGEAERLATPIVSDCREGLRLAAYPDFGLFIYKSSRLYLAIRCGRGDINKIGNHAHNDNLSFEMAFDGNVLITDPGTYVYTPLPHMRNRFRSTSMHNTLVIDGKEQNDWKEGREGLFLLRDRSNPRVITSQPTHFIGEHSGFGACHRREMRITQNGIEACDHFEGEGAKKVLFHVPPSLNVSLSPRGTGVDLSSHSHTYTLLSVGGEWSIADSYHSNGYGLLARSHVIFLKTESHRIEWTINV
jgi:uncharacterized heparinase superfamily protein